MDDRNQSADEFGGGDDDDGGLVAAALVASGGGFIREEIQCEASGAAIRGGGRRCGGIWGREGVTGVGEEEETGEKRCGGIGD